MRRRRYGRLLSRHLVALGAAGFIAGCAWGERDERFVGVYCYATLASPTCYTRPLPQDYDRLLGYSGPPPQPLPDKVLGEALPPPPVIARAGIPPESHPDSISR